MKNTDYLERCIKNAVKAEILIYKINVLLAGTEISDNVYDKINGLLKDIWEYEEKVGKEIEKAPF